ncbi:MAG: LamG domain-containing protein, partial [Alistipes sp.]|nr:LamG domain-containing protein [Alistipes sp.]
VTAGGTISDNTLLETNRWYHIAITYKNAVVSGGVTQEQGEIKIYIDGELVSSAGFGNNAPVNLLYKDTWADIGGFIIGSSWDSNRWMFGDICEARLWQVTRSIDEIQETMFELDPATPGLLGYWKFDEGEGNFVHDYSGNGRDGNAANDLSWIDVELPDEYFAQQ